MTIGSIGVNIRANTMYGIINLIVCLELIERNLTINKTFLVFEPCPCVFQAL